MENDFLISCNCGKKYEADPCTEKNVIRRRNPSGRIILLAKCPYCGRVEEEGTDDVR